jgi:hypothetical protein
MDENYFKDRSNLAKKYNKPLILEEYGMRREGELKEFIFLLTSFPLFSQQQLNHIIYSSFFHFLSSLLRNIAGYLPSREPLFQFFHDSVNNAGYACTLVWGVSHYSTDAGTSGKLFGYDDNQGYIFPYTSNGSFNSDGAAAVQQQYRYMQGKVGLNMLLKCCII